MPLYQASKNILTAFFVRTAIVIVVVAVLAAVFFYYFELYNFKKDITLNFNINAGDIFKHRQYLSTESDIHDIQRYMDRRISVDKRIQKFAVYDENMHLIYETVRPGFSVAGFLEAHRNRLHLSEGLEGVKIEILDHNGEMYLWVASSVKNVSDVLIGFVEAIEKVDKRDVALFREKRFFSVAAAVFFVLLLTAALFPLFLRAYHELRENEKLLLASNLSTVKSLGDAIALRDSETSLHNFRVTLYAIALGEEIGLSGRKMRSLIKGAFLHDVGKIGIADSILLKRGSLTEQEFNVMKTHVELGIEIVEKDPWFNDALEVIRYHHEKYEGGGYPQGIERDMIPLNARIFAIVDVFDALTSERPYKKSYKLEKACSILREGSGTHFDAELLDIFLKISPELYRDIAHLDKDVLERLLKEKVEYYFL